MKELGADQFEIVVPSISIKAEPPVALVDGNVDAKGTRKVAEAYLDYLYSDAGQKIIAKHFYRPSNPAAADPEDLKRFPEVKLVTIDDPIFGGWAKVQPTHFADGGIFDQIYQAGQLSSHTWQGQRVLAFRKPSVIPGFGLTLGFTLTYLSLIVLIPLAGLVLKTVRARLARVLAACDRPAHLRRAEAELRRLVPRRRRSTPYSG